MNPNLYRESSNTLTTCSFVSAKTQSATRQKIRYKAIIKPTTSNQNADIIQNSNPALDSKDVGIVMLGRYGDILNIWPVLWKLYKEGHKVTLYVAEEFADVRTWASWLDVVPLKVSYDAVKTALNLIESKHRLGSNLIVPQIYGNPFYKQSYTENFCAEQYYQFGKTYYEGLLLGHFDQIEGLEFQERIPPEIDQLLQEVEPPIILVNCAGRSSPFPFNLSNWLKKEFPKHVIALDRVRVSRPIDLWHLYSSRKALLITVDTFTLHLCGASNIPYISFISDKPSAWHGSYTRNNCLARIAYSETVKWLDWVGRAVEAFLKPAASLAFVSTKIQAKTPESAQRYRFARSSRKFMALMTGAQYIEVAPVRTYNDGGIRELWYIKDILNEGFQLSGADWIVFTNDDIIIPPSFRNALAIAFSLNAPVWLKRRSFFEDFSTHKLEYPGNHDYVGGDGCILPRSWWNIYQEKFPDMLIGACRWDDVMQVLIEKYGGATIHGLLSHRYHQGTWNDPKIMSRLTSNSYNRALADQFARQENVKLP